MNEIAYTEKQKRAFRRAALILQKMGREGAQFYLAGGTLNLMSGDHHEGLGDAQRDRVVDSVIIPGMDGGDW